MNSFQELNFYSNVGVPFGDDRDYVITFSANTATNSNISVNEGNVFAVVPGIEITSVVSTPRDIIYTVNVASLSGAVVTWTDPLPEGLTANTGGTGIYRVYGVNGPNVWNQVRTPNITMPRDFNGAWTYTSSITYPNTANVTLSNTISWTNSVTVTGVGELTFSEVSSGVTYDQYQTTVVDPYVIVTDNEPDGIYTLIISANGTNAIDTITSSGTGGNVVYNDTNRTYTITGYRDQVNDHLSSLVFRPEFEYTSDFSMYYTLKNPDGVQTDQIQQQFYIGNQYPVLSTPANVTYTQDTAFTISSYAALGNDSAWSPVPTYTITVTPSTTAAINTMTTSGSGGTASFNGSSKVLTVSGTRLQINSHLSTLNITPAAYYNQNYTLTYLVTSPGGTPVVQNINIGTVSVTLTSPDDVPYDEDVTVNLVDTADIVISNYGIAAVTLPFTMNIKPAVSNSISSISSSGSLGATKSLNATSKIYTIQGNLAQISSELANVSITPGTDYATNFDLYYTLNNVSGNVNANVSQSWLIGGTNVETINVSDNRYYVKNRGGYLFPNTVPAVYETIAGTPEYTVSLTLGSNIGTILSSNDTLLVGNTTTYSNVTTTVTANVISCINFDGTNGSTPGNIDLVSGHTVSYLGTTALSTAQSKFGSASLAIDYVGAGVGGLVINPPTSTYFDFGVADFTMEGWVYFPSAVNVHGGAFIDFRTADFQDSKTYSDFFTVSGSNIYFNIWLGSALNGTKPMTAGSWNHIAITRTNKTFKSFINGELDINSYQDRILTAGTFTPTPHIGTKYSASGGYSTPMYVDDLRMVKGVSLYKSSFSVPTATATPAGTTVTVLTAVPVSDFTAPNWYNGNLTYSITGTKQSINSQLANVYMYPNRDVMSTTTLTYTQSRNGILQTTAVVDLIGSDSAALESVTYTFDDPNTTYTFTPTISQILYQDCEFLAVAGGGAGGNSYPGNVNRRTYGGGGGAGGLFYQSDYTGFGSLGDYTITIGRGAVYQGYYTNGTGSTYAGPTKISFSDFDIINLLGGGNGGVGNGTPNFVPYWYGQGTPGGSGGGAGGDRNYELSGGLGTTGQGYNGGSSYYSAYDQFAAGGGGATAEGGGYQPGAEPDTYGSGGAGLVSSITGVAIEYAHGGDTMGFGVKTSPGSGGFGGSAIQPSVGSGQYTDPGPGRDGVVIIRFY